MAYPLGFRFHPTKEELTFGYLRPKNLNGDTSDVDRFIRTIIMSEFDPWKLPSQSVIQSRDKFWYFFCRIEKKYKTGAQQIRQTPSGFWKKTGPTMAIMSETEQIGEKRVLVFHFNGSKTNWVMHEYHLSPFDPSMEYTICKVKFKGAESEMYSPPVNETSLSSITDVNNSGGLSSGSEVAQSQNLAGFEEISFEPEEELQDPRLLTSFPYLEEEAKDDEEWKSYLNDDEQVGTVFMQEDYNDYRPKKPITSVVIGDDSDSDSISVTTNSIHTWTTCDSFGSFSHRIGHIADLQESPNSTIKPREVSQTLGKETETGEDQLGQATIKNKRAGSFYRMIQKLVKKMNLCYST